MSSLAENPLLETVDPFVERPHGSVRWTWPLFALLAIVVFHLTANAPVAAVAFCLHFGRRWFLTAAWLNRTDPNRSRGITCSLFYFSCAMSTIMLAALLTTLGLIVLFSWADRQADPTPLFVTMGILVGGGFTGAGLLSLIGVIRAAMHRQPIWVDPMVYWSYRESAWPPLKHVSRNRVENQVSMAQLFVLFGLPTVFLLVCGREAFANNMRVFWVLAPPIVFGLCVAIPGILFYVAKDRVIALSPRQCWGHEPQPDRTRAITESDGASGWFADR